MSDIIFLLNYYVIRYRKKIIKKNLRIAFPEYTPQQYRKIIRGFYRNFGDTVVEVIKAISISRDQIVKRSVFTGLEALEECKKNDQYVVYLASHQCNWEWMLLGGTIPFPHHVYGVYKPLRNKRYDRLMRRVREKFGTTLIPMDQIVRHIASNRNEIASIGLVADQRPFVATPKRWVQMFNRKTAFHPGIEQIPKLTNAVVFFPRIQRLRRGYYRTEMIKISSPPYNNDKNSSEIMELYVQELEKMIRDNPSDWLWSHDRWKYTPEEARVWVSMN